MRTIKNFGLLKMIFNRREKPKSKIEIVGKQISKIKNSPKPINKEQKRETTLAEMRLKKVQNKNLYGLQDYLNRTILETKYYYISDEVIDGTVFVREKHDKYRININNLIFKKRNYGNN